MEEIEGLEFPDADTVVLDGQDVSGLTITIGDVMAAGHCVRGAKRWFDVEKGLDFKLFLKQGISAYEFLSTRDAHAVGIVRNKLSRMNG